MTYDMQRDDANCILRISGDVDIACAPQLKALVQKLGAPHSIVVNVEGLRYADTTFLRFLLHLRKQTKSTQRDSVRLIGANKNLRRVLEITGLNRYFLALAT